MSEPDASSDRDAPASDIGSDSGAATDGGDDGNEAADIPDPFSDEEIRQIHEQHAVEGDPGGLADPSFERGSIYATVRLPGLGVWDEDGHHSTARVREMSGEEDMYLSDPEGIGAEALEEVAAACVERIGPYEGGEAAEIVRDGGLLDVDYHHLLIKIRELSVGDELAFQYRCPNPRCGHEGRHEASLDDLSWRVPVPPTPGNRERSETVDPRPDLDVDVPPYEVDWHFTTRRDARWARRIREHLEDRIRERAERRQRPTPAGAEGGDDDRDVELQQTDVYTILIATHFDRLAGPIGDGGERREIEVHRGGDPPATKGVVGVKGALEAVRGLPTRVRQRLVERFNAVEPSYNTTVRFGCDGCGRTVTRNVSPTDPNFFFPAEANAA